MNQDPTAERRAALSLLASATPEELQAPLARHWPTLVVADLRPAETGLVMLRGRAGGDGAAFNIGEATVSRAAVQLDGGERGFGHRLGRDVEQARRVAIFDALWQRERLKVERLVLATVTERLAAERERKASETAATRVDFFTLVRGEA